MPLWGDHAEGSAETAERYVGPVADIFAVELEWQGNVGAEREAVEVGQDREARVAGPRAGRQHAGQGTHQRPGGHGLADQQIESAVHGRIVLSDLATFQALVDASDTDIVVESAHAEFPELTTMVQGTITATQARHCQPDRAHIGQSFSR